MVGDLDRGGDEDIAVANAQSDNVMVHMGVGDGTLLYTAGMDPRFVDVGDVTGDQILDVFLGDDRGVVLCP